MNRPDPNLPIVHLKPGQIIFSKSPQIIATVLGSCASVIMYSPRLAISAICHSVLPGIKEDGAIPGDSDKFKYLDRSFEEMYRWMMKNNVKHNEMIIKAFGGGNVLQFDSHPGSNPTIGLQNIDKTIRLVIGKQLQFTSLDMGGDCGRKIYFYSHTGEVLLKRIKKMEIESSFSPLGNKKKEIQVVKG